MYMRLHIKCRIMDMRVLLGEPALLLVALEHLEDALQNVHPLFSSVALCLFFLKGVVDLEEVLMAIQGCNLVLCCLYN